MYAFPRLTVPPAAVKAAAKQGKPADFLYCMELLDRTGIVTVPGSGFGQVGALRVCCRPQTRGWAPRVGCSHARHGHSLCFWGEGEGTAGRRLCCAGRLLASCLALAPSLQRLGHLLPSK